MIRFRIALVALLLAGTSSIVIAQGFDDIFGSEDSAGSTSTGDTAALAVEVHGVAGARATYFFDDGSDSEVNEFGGSRSVPQPGSVRGR